MSASRTAPTLDALRTERARVIELAGSHGAHNVRVYGSVARGQGTVASDVDFLVDFEMGKSLFDLGALIADLEELLRCRVDVTTTRELRPRVRDQVLRDAVALQVAIAAEIVEDLEIRAERVRDRAEALGGMVCPVDDGGGSWKLRSGGAGCEAGCMATRLVSVVIDSVDPPALATWWANALGWRVVACADGDAAVAHDGGHVDDLSLLFVKVADLSRGKNRVHLDLGSRSPTHQQELVEQLVDAGANRLDVGQDDVSWVVLADPEDNALCVLAPDDRFDPAPALAAIAIDARQPGALAAFWARATGWHVESSSHLIASLCHPSGLPPSLDLLAVDEPTPGKNRVHLDVAPGADGDRAVEVARLERAGARPADVGQGSEVPWTVLTDPDGNEFCVLDPR